MNMPYPMLLRIFLVLWASSAVTLYGQDTPAKITTVDFNRDIRPILTDRCFQCHGPNEASREGGFRLDVRTSALGEATSGAHPITPRNPDTSALLRKILAEDPAERMPPADSGKPPLDARQVSLIRKWIEQGATYQKHWAFVAPQHKAAPPVKQAGWSQGPIDQFLLARMEQAGLAPSPPADRATLIRRLSFDLTGLPPTPEEIEDFEKDTSPQSYEKVVQRLLRSTHFGEKMALTWLDASRYADTNGYLQNGYRVSWPWRDWLVQAWNNNLPYDRFIAELLAGDLAKDPTDETRLATCFLRMHMITSEGGSLDEEFRVEYAADRAETVSTVFMGLTMNCCRCHDHKFDPFSQQEYFQVFSIFADPQGEDPVLDHSRNPAFPPFIQFAKERFGEESRRLDDCTLMATAAKNTKAESRLSLQKKMLESGLQVMVMKENPSPRQNYVLRRGSYSDPDKDRPVQRGGLDSVFAWKDAFPRNRLGFSQWLTDPGHPLTARVEVNRLWTNFMGRGLVATQEDFGRQGAYPSHPDLLDHLAVEFREGGWDRKALIRQIVLSAAYRQASQLTTQHREVDPTNRLLARMDRRRLPAEAIRDQALFVAGLLNTRIGGHPALPYQPDRLWLEGANNPGYGRGKLILTSIYETSAGNELYRRSLYTFWNRNAPPPQMVIFDVPGRSFSAVSRSVTNTPLQALVTMNDTQFVEAARMLAERVLQDAGLADDRARLTNIVRRCTGRTLSADDEKRLLDGLNAWRQRYMAQPDDAVRLLAGAGQSPRDAKLAAAEHAAWMMVATTVLNFDAALVVD